MNIKTVTKYNNRIRSSKFHCIKIWLKHNNRDERYNLVNDCFWPKAVTHNRILGGIRLESHAEQGHASAQNNLGGMYADGRGVLEDDVYAYMWWNLAAAQGHKNSSKNKNILSKKMTSSQIEEAQRLSRECMKKDYKNC